MTRITRSFLLAIILMTAAPGLASANSAQVSLIRVASGACVTPLYSGASYGVVQFSDQIVSPASPGVAGVVQVNANVKTNSLLAGSYTAEIVRVTLDASGAVTGCESLPAGTFNVPRNGVARFNGSAQFAYGPDDHVQPFALRLTSPSGLTLTYLSGIAPLTVAA
jgi:hypothetical protein